MITGSPGYGETYISRISTGDVIAETLYGV